MVLPVALRCFRIVDYFCLPHGPCCCCVAVALPTLRYVTFTRFCCRVIAHLCSAFTHGFGATLLRNLPLPRLPRCDFSVCTRTPRCPRPCPHCWLIGYPLRFAAAHVALRLLVPLVCFTFVAARCLCPVPARCREFTPRCVTLPRCRMPPADACHRALPCCCCVAICRLPAFTVVSPLLLCLPPCRVDYPVTLHCRWIVVVVVEWVVLR